MTGAVFAFAGAAQSAGGGAGNHPNAMAWTNPYGSTIASTQVLTVSGVGGGTAPITATSTGGAVLSYLKNGVSTVYTGAFTVSDGDTLGWSLLNLTTGTESGTVAVSSGAFAVSTFTYVVRGNTYF